MSGDTIEYVEDLQDPDIGHSEGDVALDDLSAEQLFSLGTLADQISSIQDIADDEERLQAAIEWAAQLAGE